LVDEPLAVKPVTDASPDGRHAAARRCTAPALWIAAALCLAVAVAMRLSDVARIGTKWLLDPLFHGTSDGAALFLLGGMAAIMATLAVFRRAGAAWLDRPDAGHVLLAFVMFAHGIGLLALFGYQERLELPWQLDGCHWSATGNTCNALLHSQLGQAGLSTLLQSFQAGTGDALLAHVPAMERWAIGLLFAGGLLATLAAAPGIARRHGWHPLAIALFGFAALDCLKTVIDGGALAGRLPPSLLMLGLMACARDTAHLRMLVRRHGPAAVVVLAACAVFQAAMESEGSDGAIAGFATLVVLYGLGLLCWAFREQARAGVRMAALVAGFGYLALGFLGDAMSGIGMLLRPLPLQARIVVVDSEGRVARDASEAMRGATPLAVYRRFGDDPLKPRRVLIEADPAALPADRPGREFAFALRFIDGRPAASTTTDGLYTLLAATRVPDRTNTAVFLFRTASPLIPPFFTATSTELGRNNFHVHMNLVAAALRAQGLHQFVLMPLVHPADRDLFLPPRRGRGGAD
jgi:hypothetical protein